MDRNKVDATKEIKKLHKRVEYLEKQTCEVDGVIGKEGEYRHLSEFITAT